MMNKSRLLAAAGTVALAAGILPNVASAEAAERIEGKVTAIAGDYRSPAWAITVDGEAYDAARRDVRDLQLGDDVYVLFVNGENGLRAIDVRPVDDTVLDN